MLVANYNTRPIDKFIHNLRQMSMSKSMTWIERIARSNRIFLRSSRDGERMLLSESLEKNVIKEDMVTEYLRVMTVLTTVLQSCYGDNWDMHVTKQSSARVLNDPDAEHWTDRMGFDLMPIIYYPSIEIESENGGTHIIKDLYMMFRIEFDEYSYREDGDIRFQIGGIQGNRSTLSFAEWNVGYRHSHLGATSKRPRAGDIMKTATYCIGSGDISTTLPQINSEEMGITEDSIGFLFSIIDTMVKWESITGAPHHRIKRITEASSALKVNDTLYDHDVHDFVRSFMGDLKDNGLRDIPRVNFSYNSGRFYPNFLDEHVEAVKELLVKNFPSFSSLIVIKRDGGKTFGYQPSAGEDLTPQVMDSQTVSGKIPYLFISGHRKYLKIGLPVNSNEEQNISNFHVRGQFLNKLKDEFSKSAYQQEVHSSIEAATAGV